jgi:hypothetical protein
MLQGCHKQAWGDREGIFPIARLQAFLISPILFEHTCGGIHTYIDALWRPENSHISEDSSFL